MHASALAFVTRTAFCRDIRAVSHLGVEMCRGSSAADTCSVDGPDEDYVKIGTLRMNQIPANARMHVRKQRERQMHGYIDKEID